MATTHNHTPTSSANLNARSNAATPRYASAGGFFRTSLPSPAPSTASSRAAARLPHPRSKPLVPGSRKEDYARDYVSQRMMHISRRYVKKHGIPDPADQVTGYESMDEVCADMEEVVDVLWFSGTPSIQIPTLLALALALNEYLPSFPPAPRPTFSLLQKLDHCFASLLVGRDVKTNEALPGFQRGLSAGFSRTDMVRIKSLADETRMLVAVVMSGEADVEDVDDEEEGDAGRRSRGRRGDPQSVTGSSSMPSCRPGASLPGTDVKNNSKNTINDGGSSSSDLEIIEDTTTPIKDEPNDDDADDDDEDEGQEFIDVEPPTHKRKAGSREALESDRNGVSGEDLDDVDQHLADEAKKRIKFKEEDEGDLNDVMMSETAAAPPLFSSGSPTYNITSSNNNNKTPTAQRNASSTSQQPLPLLSASKGKEEEEEDHQFHWTVEDSDSDSDPDTGTGQRRPAQGTSSSTTAANIHSAQGQAGRGDADNDENDEGEDEDDDDDENDEDDEEEEELHLNVAKVYEKTLTQLGETLGESIIDE